MKRLCILTPDPDDDYYGSRASGVLDRLAEALGEGFAVSFEPWTSLADSPDVAAHDLILPLVAWGYHRQAERWREASSIWAARGLPMANPASVLGWNANKTYLGALERRGVPIPPTLWVETPDAAAIATARDRFGGGPVVVKPTVSGGAWRTLRLEPGDTAPDLPAGSWMIQPFLSSIVDQGELSLLFFGRRFSHAVNKRPVDGDFRVQVQFGGLYDAVEPDEAAMVLAERVLAAIDERLLYARIDMTRDPGGAWVLMEAELIEPDFYLAHDPGRGENLRRAVDAWLA